MKVSEQVRNNALSIIDLFMNRGFMDYFRSEDYIHCSMWSWAHDHDLFREGFEYMDGATKGVFFHADLEGWVIKFRLPNEQRDYCARELENYIAAREAGLAYYFAAIEYLCEREGICFYLQEEAELCEQDVDSALYDKLQCQYDSSGTNYDQECLWREVEDMTSRDRVMLLYGNEALADFVLAHRINDLHCGNFGVSGDHYVMIDYSGYGEFIWTE